MSRVLVAVILSFVLLQTVDVCAQRCPTGGRRFLEITSGPTSKGTSGLVHVVPAILPFPGCPCSMSHATATRSARVSCLGSCLTSVSRSAFVSLSVRLLSDVLLEGDSGGDQDEFQLRALRLSGGGSSPTRCTKCGLSCLLSTSLVQPAPASRKDRSATERQV